MSTSLQTHCFDRIDIANDKKVQTTVDYLLPNAYKHNKFKEKQKKKIKTNVKYF